MSKKCWKCCQIKPLSDFHNSKRRKDGKSDKCKECVCAYNKEHRDYQLEIKRRHYHANKEAYAERGKLWKKKHPKYSPPSENTLNRKISKNLRIRLYSAIKNNRKIYKTFDLLGCSIYEFKKYLEFRFTPEMTWENYGKVWHIDHIRPCASFDLSKEENQKECFHYTNLQPLEAFKNLSKGKKLNWTFIT